MRTVAEGIVDPVFTREVLTIDDAAASDSVFEIRMAGINT